MTQASKILELIETVNPDDSDALDEIDARAWCWVKNKNIDEHFELDAFNGVWVISKEIKIQDNFQYTRSRDALKSIRPEGWAISGNYQYKWGLHTIFLYKWGMENASFESKMLPTEELAELHAIIQAIEYERNNP